jgi:hypothetical protein
MGEVVFVDRGESGDLPDAIRSQLGGTIPIVVIADPAGEKIYGRYDYSVLRTKDFSSIFRQAKRDLRDDLKNGVVPANAAADESASKTKPSGGTTPEPGGKAIEASKFADLTFEEWTSRQGTKMEAKLEGVTGDELTLKARDGRVIKLKRSQLSEQSQIRLKKITG